MQKTITTEVEIDVDLDDYSDDDLIEEMEKRGFTCSQESASNFDHVEHLILCGQLAEAKSEALSLVEELIGREFK